MPETKETELRRPEKKLPLISRTKRLDEENEKSFTSMKMKERKHCLNIRRLLLIFLICLFLSWSCGTCLCMMPGGNDGGVNLGLIEAYRPLMNRLPAESSSQYLFNYLEDLDPIIRTGRLGLLPRPDEAHDFICQLYPQQLEALLNSLADEGFVRAWPQVYQEQFRDCSTALLQVNRDCLATVNNIAQSMSVLYDRNMANGRNMANLSLEETFSFLLENLNFSPEMERIYAEDLLRQTSRLFCEYNKILVLLLRVR